jgi:hypothetical protein
MNKTVFITVEYLNALLALRLLGRRLLKVEKADIYYIDASKLGLHLSNLFKLPLKILDFKLVDIRDEKDDLIRLRIAYFDFTEVQKKILKHPLFKQVIDACGSSSYLPQFLTKRISSFDLGTHDTVWRAMLLVHIALWQKKQIGTDERPILFMRRRIWQEDINAYAKAQGVLPIVVSNMHYSVKTVVVMLCARYMEGLRGVWMALKSGGILGLGRFVAARYKNPSIKAPLAVEYYGHLNADSPELYSDMFFVQESDIEFSDTAFLFHLAQDPINEQKKALIDKLKLKAIALNPLAAKTRNTEMFSHWPMKNLPNLPQVPDSFNWRQSSWIRQQINLYAGQYDFWIDLFLRYETKVYVSWFNTHAAHCAISEAIFDASGVSVIYQRSYQELPSIETSIGADIAFAFSPLTSELERASLSKIKYHVVVGYMGDHRFELLKPKALELRRQLIEQGAVKIITFFDENSANDSRWHTGHEFMRDNYRFILTKLLEDPTLGIILKPKVPSSLRRRLGPDADLLQKALSTGRCLLLEGGALHSSYPPALAALASDVTIHGHLCAATAGIESALAGVPTLLLDREGWSFSRLYALPGGKVVFKDWEHLWSAMSEHFKKPVSGFGDWSPIINEIDPFRDGLAARRMGTYIQWLLEGFKAGLDRETVLANAAEQYASVWGKDKITSINI